jgi:hypothetical protein
MTFKTITRKVLILTFDLNEVRRIKHLLRMQGYEFFCSPLTCGEEIDLLIKNSEVVYPGKDCFKNYQLSEMILKCCKAGLPILSKMRCKRIMSEKIRKYNTKNDAILSEVSIKKAHTLKSVYRNIYEI